MYDGQIDKEVLCGKCSLLRVWTVHVPVFHADQLTPDVHIRRP